jgi:hypothetical protein
MRPSLFLAAFAAANGVAASRIPNTKYLDKPPDVSSYLSSLVPVAKDVLLNQVAGPSIGADVNSRHVFPHHSRMLMLFDSLLSPVLP